MAANELPGYDGLTGTYMVISTEGLAFQPFGGVFDGYRIG